jgi:hypothetical protein
MRRVIFLILVAAAAASCGDAGDDAPGTQEPVYKECMAPASTITTMAALESLGAQGCERLVGYPKELVIRGEAITSLEPLRSLRVIQRLVIESTSITSLEPLRDVQEVVTDVRFEENAKISYCEITGWVALVKSRDPNGNFGSTVDNPRQNSPCSTVNYP